MTEIKRNLKPYLVEFADADLRKLGSDAEVYITQDNSPSIAIQSMPIILYARNRSAARWLFSSAIDVQNSKLHRRQQSLGEWTELIFTSKEELWEGITVIEMSKKMYYSMKHQCPHYRPANTEEMADYIILTDDRYAGISRTVKDRRIVVIGG